MPEDFKAKVDRILRDHEGYTGDGRGGDGDLPIGDRSTAKKPISKRDLRESIKAFGDIDGNATEALLARDQAVAAAATAAADAADAANAQIAPYVAAAADAANAQIAPNVVAAELAEAGAQTAQGLAETARDAAFVNADVYPDIATGLAAVADGEQFQVVSGNEVVRYRRDSGSTQTEMARFYNKGGVEAVTNSLASGVPCAIILPGLAGIYPNLNTDSNILEMPADMIIKSSGPGKLASYVLPAASIDLSVAGSSAKAVYYNTSAPGYVVKDHGAALTSGEKAACLLVAVVRRTGIYGNTLTISCEHTVNGKSPYAGLDYASDDWAVVFTPIDGVTPDTNYPNYSPATRTLTFYPDSILFHGTKQWVMPSGASITVGVSSANKVFWDTTSNTLVTTVWSQVLTAAQREAYVTVAGIRDSSAIAGVPPVISMMCPYTVDNRIFGIVTDENRSGASIEGIHHRGYSAVYPEGTLAAYRGSVQANTYCLEGDVRWTSDGVPVIFHDDTVDRTTDGTGTIESKTLAQVKALDAGSWKAARFAGEQIITFEELMRFCKKSDCYAYIEVKTDATLTQVQGLLEIVKNTGMKGRIEFDCGFATVLLKIIGEDPTQRVGYLSGAWWAGLVDYAETNLKTGSNRVSIVVDHSTVTEPNMEEARAAGIDVVCFTVNTAVAAVTVADLGVDGIMTDLLNIAHVLRDDEVN